MTTPHQAGVIGFYDTHPINEAEIRAKLRARGLADDAVTEREMSEFDQDHYGGVAALEALADAAGITASTRVLDVCSGMGGPAPLARAAPRLPRHRAGLDGLARRRRAPPHAMGAARVKCGPKACNTPARRSGSSSSSV